MLKNIRFSKFYSIFMLLLVLVISNIFISNTNVWADESNSLLYKLDFSDSENIFRNNSGNDYDDTIAPSNHNLSVEDSKVGKALNFPGDSYLENYLSLPTDIFENQDVITMAGWFYLPENAGSYLGEIGIYSVDNEKSFRADPVGEHFGVSYIYAYGNPSDINLYTGVKPVYNAWYHMAYVIDGNSKEFIVYQNGHDGNDNNLLFYNTSGKDYMFAEATFKVTDVYNDEKWGKFGLMLFEDSDRDGLFYYVDAYIGDNKTAHIDNIEGTSLGHNLSSDGWGDWNTIKNTNNSFNLSTKKIVLRMTVFDDKLYLWKDDTLVEVINYKNNGNLTLGIKSFAYGLELTDYYSTTNPTDDKFIKYLPSEINLDDAHTLGGEQIFIQGTYSNLIRETEYSIEFDFEIENGNQGFVFGYQNEDNFIMWQVNTNASPNYEKILLRPHFRVNGEWRVDDIDITEAMLELLNILEVEDILGMKIREKIDVRK